LTFEIDSYTYNVNLRFIFLKKEVKQCLTILLNDCYN